jgi:uncharacterized protein YkwD
MNRFASIIKHAVVLSLTLVMAGASVAAAGPTAKAHRLSTEEYKFLLLVRKHANQGRNIIKYDPLLCKVARAKAKDMIVRNFFNHTDPSGRGPNFMLARAGYRLPAYYSSDRSGNNVESIAKLTGGPKDAFILFLKSPAHRPHVLAEDQFYRAQTHIGAGSYKSKKAPFYNTFVFLSAPRNLNQSVPALLLRAPNGKIIGKSGQ